MFNIKKRKGSKGKESPELIIPNKIDVHYEEGTEDKSPVLFISLVDGSKKNCRIIALDSEFASKLYDAM